MIKHILVIDDEPGVCDAFKLALKPTGHVVECAGDGLSGIEAASRQRPDLVFLDLKMPGIDGVETLRRLKKQEPNLNVFIVTAFQAEYFQSLKQAREEGLEFELAIKPMEAEQIRMVVRIGMH